jgi:gliding-associated putative ABC transporter substrate-binding component GldG
MSNDETRDKREGKGRDVSRRRQWISGTNAVVVVAAAIGIAILANAIVSQMSGLRVDLTEDQIYTLSEPSRDVVRNLEQPVQVKAFISADMPPPHHTLRQRVKDLLTEYAASGGDNFTFQVIAPDDDPETEEAAKGYGCEKVGIGQRGKDKVSLRAVFKCVAFVQGENQEVIKDLRGGAGARGNFEYEFTKALMNLTDRQPRKVAFVKGFGGPADNQQFSQQIGPVFDRLYGDLIKPTTVDLSTKNRVPEGISALVILNPDGAFSGKAKYAIDQFIQRGGSVGWYQSSTGVDREMQRKMMQQMGARARQMPTMRKPLNPGLGSFFGSLGIEHNQDLVLDRQNALAMGMVRTQRGFAQVSHPAVFTIPKVNRQLPFAKSLTTLAMPAPASLTVKAAARDDDKIEVFEVLQTADSAVRRPNPPESLSYQQLQDPVDSEEPGPFVLGAALQGDLPSYFDEHAIPEGVTEKGGDAEETDKAANSRLLVVGSGTFYRPVQSLGYNQRLAQMGSQFFISSIEWLVQDSSLTEIRSKSMPRLVGEVDSRMKRAIQFVNIACVPALFALIGIGMMVRRRRRREELTWSGDE